MTNLPRPLGLPDFPWNSLAPYRTKAEAHDGGICDLSVGTPVDPTPQFIRDALAEASDSHGYPTVIGTVEVRQAILDWAARRGLVDCGLSGCLPTIGSKEAVAWLPKLLGVGPGDTVLLPDVAYPTYEVGILLAGATPVAVDPRDPASWPTEATMVWLNTPGNPHGHVMSRDELRAVIAWARANGAVVASDECYAALPWDPELVTDGVPSLLSGDVCDGDPSGLLVLYSLSKQSNLAGYRAALIVGDPALVAPVVEVRKHAGLIVPGPVQHAMAVALADDAHVAAQREVYGARRAELLAAVEAAGLEVDPDTRAGLYLWVRAGATDGDTTADSWTLVDRFAELGILVAPGDFYGPAGQGWVRAALTESDERIRTAAERLRGTNLFHSTSK